MNLKRFLTVFTLSCLSLVPVRAQETAVRPDVQALDELVAETLDALVDTMNKFSYILISDVNSGRLYDTSLYIRFGDGFSNSVLELASHKPSGLKCMKNGRVEIYAYKENRYDKWMLTKKVKTQKEFNIATGPTVKFCQDTVVITMGSSYVSWRYWLDVGWSWVVAISDWIVCKFVYSEADRRWQMVDSSFHGI